jgi:hypothetical protein
MSQLLPNDGKPPDGGSSQRPKLQFRLPLLWCLLLILNAGCVGAAPALLGLLFLGRERLARPPFLDLSPEAIWVMDPKVRFFDDSHPLSPADLQRVREIPGLASASPIRHDFGYARLPYGEAQLISLWGLDDAAAAVSPGDVTAGLTSNLQNPDAIILDEAGFRRLWPGEAWRPGMTLEMNARRAVVVGVMRNDLGLQSSPFAWTRFERMKDYVPHEGGNSERDSPSFILCRAESGAPPAEVCRRIEQQTGLRALPGDQLSELDTAYWWGKTQADSTALSYALLSPFALAALAVGFGVSWLGLFLLGRSRDAASGHKAGRAVGGMLAKALTLGAAGALLALPVVYGVSQFVPVTDIRVKFTAAMWLSGAAEALTLNLAAALAAWAIVVWTERGTAS